jgi:RND family efflux transporter MFP subunit
MVRRYLLVGVAVVSGGCRMGEATSGRAAAAQPGDTGRAGARIVNVETVSVAPEPFADVVTVTGTVAPDRDVVVASEESGVIRSVFVEKGARVAADQPIVKIDDRLLQAQYDQAVAEAKLARETYERQRRLWEEDSIGSELAYLRAKYGAETAEANARVLATRLERTTVRAPIAGVLDDRLVEVGSTVTPGSPVARVIDADPLEVSAGVPERYAGDIRPGARAVVAFDNGVEVDGRASYVGTSIDEQNRTFPVEVVLPNTGGKIKPGMVANVRVARAGIVQAILVPREAVQRGESGYFVYVAVQRDGRWVAESRLVRTGSGDGRRVVIEDGLSAGEQVISVGYQQVTAGDHVRITTAAARLP